MKKLMLALCCVAALAGCANTQSTQVSYVQACAGYGVAFNTALNLRIANKLTPAQIDQVTLIDSQITPICTGPLPVNPEAATVQITAAVTSLALIEAINRVSKP
jgi:hypothetical protein